jgi:CheY-like chemotaxis protein/two-component sensor histidine kinase
MANLSDQLLAYARGGKYQPKIVSIHQFLENTVPVLKHLINPDIGIETDFSEDILNIEADLTQMQMVLSAVLINSSEAIEGDGRIRITTSVEEVDEEFVKHHPSLKPGPCVCLTIEDDGKGMDQETRSRIFEPFFTTKFQGRGLGMASAYGIIKNHDGWISVYSELGVGTAIRIYLPAVDVHIEEVAKPKVEPSTGEGTILLIEDETMVADVGQAMLKHLGYSVLWAKNGAEAVDMVSTFKENIDLVLLDVKLPDMDGGRIYHLITKIRPNLKVIVCSGYSVYGPAQQILDAGAQEFIQKPFTIRTLSEKLKDVLALQRNLTIFDNFTQPSTAMG